MKLFATLLALTFSLYVHAADTSVYVLQTSKTVEFDYSSLRSFYHCDYVEASAKKWLKKLGATQVDVDCRFGLPFNRFIASDIRFTSATISKAATAVPAAVKTVTLKVTESCDFNEELIETLLDNMAVVSFKKKGVCWDSSGRLTYTVEVLQ